MSVRVMTAVFDHSQSRLADRLVLLVIADRSDDDGTGCYRGKESIARMAHVSRSTVTESLAALEALGELVIEHRAGRTSQYRVLLPGVGQNPADPEIEGGQDLAGGSAGRVADGRPDGWPRSIPDTSLNHAPNASRKNLGQSRRPGQPPWKDEQDAASARADRIQAAQRAQFARHQAQLEALDEGPPGVPPPADLRAVRPESEDLSPPVPQEG